MAVKRHLKVWNWTLLMVLCYIRYSFATETAIVIAKYTRTLYKAKLTSNRPTVEPLVPDVITDSRCVYSKLNHEIVWGDRNYIKKLFVNESGPPSTIQVGVTVKDVALDSKTGNIIFGVAEGTIYALTTSGRIALLYQHGYFIQSITVDDLNRQICICEHTGRIICFNMNGRNVYVKSSIVFCRWITYHGGLFYWTHLNGDISSGALAHVGDFRRIYSGMRINCFTFYRNYMYASSGWALYKININSGNNVKEEAMFRIDLHGINSVAVFEQPQIKCPTSIPNGKLPYNCKAKVDESCDNYTCDRGYQRNGALVALSCTDSGIWNLNVSALCQEIKCPTSIPNGRLPYNCKAIVDESCDNYTCDRGYQRNGALVPLACTKSGIWNLNVSVLCQEIKCPTSIPNGRLPYNCKAIVDESCDNYTCDRGYQRNGALMPLACTKLGIWNLNVSVLCQEIKCPTSIPNGRLPYNCKAIVDESCDNYTCDRGYQRNGALVALSCTDSGIWNLNVSILCQELVIDVNRDAKASIVIVVIASSIFFVVASMIGLLVKKRKHIPNNCCGDNKTERVQSQRGDNYLTAVYSVSSRDSVVSGHTYIDHYDSIYDDLDALEDYTYLTPAIGALRVQHP